MSTDIYESSNVDKKRAAIPNHRKSRVKPGLEKKRRRRSSNQGFRRLIHVVKKDGNRKYVSLLLITFMVLMLLYALYSNFFKSFSAN